MCVRAGVRAYLRDEATRRRENPLLRVRTFKLSSGTCLPINCEPKRLKPKLDIVEKPENRVH